jgi:hypothetical protein
VRDGTRGLRDLQPAGHLGVDRARQERVDPHALVGKLFTNEPAERARMVGLGLQLPHLLSGNERRCSGCSSENVRAATATAYHAQADPDET